MIMSLEDWKCQNIRYSVTRIEERRLCHPRIKTMISLWNKNVCNVCEKFFSQKKIGKFELAFDLVFVMALALG